MPLKQAKPWPKAAHKEEADKDEIEARLAQQLRYWFCGCVFWFIVSERDGSECVALI